MTNLEITDARKRFGSVTALDGASLSLPAGELLGLLGPNGAGKTTLVRAVAGRVRLNSGAIEMMGRPLDDRGPSSGATLPLSTTWTWTWTWTWTCL